jgi:hypothetical protein
MSTPEPGAGALRSADIEAWLASLGLSPTERADRDGITSWDLILDGRRRFDLRLTVILDPAFAVILWAHYAPPITDMFRRSYRKLLRWNDEFPFAKFSVSEDERPVLAVEVPAAEADADALGLAIARILGIADTLLDESKDWLWIGGRMPDPGDRVSANAAFLDRFPNANVDMAARMSQVQYQSVRNFDKVRNFFIKYQDRLLYGTDLTINPGDDAAQFKQEAHGFWMRNTLLPLDLIFIDKDKKVVEIVRSAEPRSLISRGGERPSLYVLEVPGGWAERTGVGVGASVALEGTGSVRIE